MAGQMYDRIGVGYRTTRGADPRIEARIWAGLGEAAHVANVGAGSGSYERIDRMCVAVEPSVQMLAQRPLGSVPAVRAVAEQLPFEDDTFDGAMAILTVHHWSDPRQGLLELRRVSRGPIVVFTFDTSLVTRTWLHEYLTGPHPDSAHLDASTIAELLGGRTEIVPIPHDCVDGFAEAFWRRPEAFLDPTVRAGMSIFARRTRDEGDAIVAPLRDDIDSGRWAAEHADLLELDEYDAGFRLVIAP